MGMLAHGIAGVELPRHPELLVGVNVGLGRDVPHLPEAARKLLRVQPPVAVRVELDEMLPQVGEELDAGDEAVELAALDDAVRVQLLLREPPRRVDVGVGLPAAVDVDPFADGDMLAARWIGTGARERGPVLFAGNDILRVRDGRIVEYWACTSS